MSSASSGPDKKRGAINSRSKQTTRRRQVVADTKPHPLGPLFTTLHPRAQRWIAAQEPAWVAFRKIQDIAIPRFLEQFQKNLERDYVVAAPTAAGKTEAVFLPLATALHATQSDDQTNGAHVLYVCPLKALIDQQLDRLAEMFDPERYPVTAWHGDSSLPAKKRFREQPRGVVIITPESLEAQFINNGHQIGFLFGRVRCVVVDEFHAFFDGPRGYQLVSLLARLDHILGRVIPRIALSATFNSSVQEEIAKLLRPANPGRVEFLRDDATRNLNFSVKCFTRGKSNEPRVIDRFVTEIYRDFSALCAPAKGLVFTDSRHLAERLANALHQMSGRTEEERIFFPHHGSLEPDVRRRAEDAIRSSDGTATIISTPTLELGIDIGSIAQVGQVFPPSRVSSLQQRLGRSGRKHNAVSSLIAYIEDEEPLGIAAADRSSFLRDLHMPTFQMLAQVHLVKAREFEPPDRKPAHLSTLIQQTLSMAAQAGVFNINELRAILIERGPFAILRSDTAGHLELLLSRLENARLLARVGSNPGDFTRGTDAGKLMDFRFYAAFPTPENYTVIGPEGNLGVMPLAGSYRVGDRIIFAGGVWAIVGISLETHTIRVSPTSHGEAPRFPGDAVPPSQKVIETMRQLYAGSIDAEKSEMNPNAYRLYQSGRAHFKASRLATRSIVPTGLKNFLLFPWRDRRGQESLIVALRYRGLSAIPAGIAIFVENTLEATLMAELKILAKAGGAEAQGHPSLPSGDEAARGVASLILDKHDRVLSPYLQRWNYATARLDLASVPAIARELLD